MSAATEAEVEAVARALARLEPGEDWPTNSALGGGLTGARDDEYRSAMREQAREAIAALDAVREVEAVTEGWLADMAKYLTLAADQCCQCDDGHHEWTTPYGTDGDVRISRDDARRIARLLVGGVPGRNEAELKDEAFAELADLYREDVWPSW